MLNVFLTVDTEVWPRTSNWRKVGLAPEIDRDILGVTRDGNFGLPFQMDMLNKHGLKAVFFVEALFACEVGLEPLREIVSMVQDRGHEVQIHIHTEWLAEMTHSLLPGRTGYNINAFSESEQAVLISKGIENLKNCGARKLCAFRAGNFGANFDTLRALSQNGILFDTSYNVSCLDSDCGLRTPDPLLQPRQIHGVYEYPVSCFLDWRGRYRHAQICACSSQELESALLGAWERGWTSFVVVSHSFELIRRRKQQGKQAIADPIVIKRFERLCRFLASNCDKFRTALFSEISPEAIDAATSLQPLRCGLLPTAWRYAEQLARRVL